MSYINKIIETNVYFSNSTRASNNAVPRVLEPSMNESNNIYAITQKGILNIPRNFKCTTVE